MQKISFKVAFPVILAGMFAVIVFIALNPEGLYSSFYIILLLLSVFIFFYGLHVGQTIAMPIEKILKRAIDLSKGDLKARFYLETKDEFGELAQIFNKIADELEKSHLSTESSEKSVGIKVKAKTQDLEETITALEQKVKNRTIEVERLMQEIKKQQGQVKIINPNEMSVIEKAKSNFIDRAPKKEKDIEDLEKK